MDAGHVRELQNAISRQANVRRAVTEPFESATGDLKRQQPLVAGVDELACLNFNLGVSRPIRFM